jgi:UDP-N-acetylmuramoylalanine--D-glutamate ligase
MQNFKTQFKDKKITIMGLGILGRGLGYTKFLAECGADLIVTDLKNKEQLKISIKALNKFKNIKFVLGEHRLQDFKDRDMVIKAAGVPLDSIYIKEAHKNNIPVEMDVSLFIKSTPKITTIGVTGTRGKSMTTTLIYEILKKNEKFLKRRVYIGGNIRGVATLPLLKQIKENDILVCELDSWQLQGFGEAKMSPNISVFTSFMPDHMNYYGDDMDKYFTDKANIFKYQKKGDMLIVRPHVRKLIPKGFQSKLIVADIKKTLGYKYVVPGEHQRENLACAVEVAELFKITSKNIKSVIKNFKGIEGRLQYVRNIHGVKIYNDNNATTLEATIAGIKALFQEGKENKIVLISGGADKKLDTKIFVSVVNTLCKAVVFIPGTGTDKLLKDHRIKISYTIANNLKIAVNQAIKYSKKGDVVLFSPAFASFGMFNNEYERNDIFMKIVKNI